MRLKRIANPYIMHRRIANPPERKAIGNILIHKKLRTACKSKRTCLRAGHNWPHGRARCKSSFTVCGQRNDTPPCTGLLPAYKHFLAVDDVDARLVGLGNAHARQRVDALLALGNGLYGLNLVDAGSSCVLHLKLWNKV